MISRCLLHNRVHGPGNCPECVPQEPAKETENLIAMTANTKQVGGEHYKADYQHWDLITDIYGPGYLIGIATGYIARHRRKNGREDLQKAIHCLGKAKECFPHGIDVTGPVDYFWKFAHANDLNILEGAAVSHTLRGSWGAAIYATEMLLAGIPE